MRYEIVRTDGKLPFICRAHFPGQDRPIDFHFETEGAAEARGVLLLTAYRGK